MSCMLTNNKKKMRHVGRAKHTIKTIGQLTRSAGSRQSPGTAHMTASLCESPSQLALVLEQSKGELAIKASTIRRVTYEICYENIDVLSSVSHMTLKMS